MSTEKLTTQTKMILKSHLRPLMDSCVEGRTGEWDCSTDEGKEGFEAMYESLEIICKLVGVNVGRVRKMP